MHAHTCNTYTYTCMSKAHLLKIGCKIINTLYCILDLLKVQVNVILGLQVVSFVERFINLKLLPNSREFSIACSLSFVLCQ